MTLRAVVARCDGVCGVGNVGFYTESSFSRYQLRKFALLSVCDEGKPAAGLDVGCIGMDAGVCVFVCVCVCVYECYLLIKP